MANKPNHVLNLTTADNRIIELTSSRLEQWTARVENPHAKQEEFNQFSTQLLSRFGIKSPSALISYLNSPEGKVVTELASEALAKEIETEEEDQFEQLELRLKNRRFLVYLLMGLLHKKEVLAKKIHHDLQEQQEKLNQLKPIEQKHESEPEPEFVVKINVQSLLNSEMALKKMIDLKLNEVNILQLKLAQFSKDVTKEDVNQHVIHKKLSLQKEKLRNEIHLLTTQLSSVEANRISLQNTNSNAPKLEPVVNIPRPAPELKRPQILNMLQIENAHRHAIVQHMKNSIANPPSHPSPPIARNRLEENQELNIRMQKISAPRMTPKFD